jgi:peroxiredoxin
MPVRKMFGPVTLALTAVLIVTGSLAGVSVAQDKGFQEKFKPGDPAPDFTTSDLDGNKYQLSSYKGKKSIMLNFWGIRCGACIEEMPYLEAMFAKYKDKDVVFLGVDTDGVNSDIIKGALKDINLKVTYPLLTDTEFTITDSYTNFLVPLTIVIDKSGIIRYIHTGFEKGREKEYEEALKKVL